MHDRKVSSVWSLAPTGSQKLSSPDKVEIREDESLLGLEAAGDNVLGVRVRKSVTLLEFERWLEQELFVV